MKPKEINKTKGQVVKKVRIAKDASLRFSTASVKEIRKPRIEFSKEKKRLLQESDIEVLEVKGYVPSELKERLNNIMRQFCKLKKSYKESAFKHLGYLEVSFEEKEEAENLLKELRIQWAEFVLAICPALLPEIRRKIRHELNRQRREEAGSVYYQSLKAVYNIFQKHLPQESRGCKDIELPTMKDCLWAAEYYKKICRAYGNIIVLERSIKDADKAAPLLEQAAHNIELTKRLPELAIAFKSLHKLPKAQEEKLERPDRRNQLHFERYGDDERLNQMADIDFGYTDFKALHNDIDKMAGKRRDRILTELVDLLSYVTDETKEAGLSQILCFSCTSEYNAKKYCFNDKKKEHASKDGCINQLSRDAQFFIKHGLLKEMQVGTFVNEYGYKRPIYYSYKYGVAKEYGLNQHVAIETIDYLLKCGAEYIKEEKVKAESKNYNERFDEVITDLPQEKIDYYVNEYKLGHIDSSPIEDFILSSNCRLRAPTNEIAAAFIFYNQPWLKDNAALINDLNTHIHDERAKYRAGVKFRRSKADRGIIIRASYRPTNDLSSYKSKLKPGEKLEDYGPRVRQKFFNEYYNGAQVYESDATASIMTKEFACNTGYYLTDTDLYVAQASAPFESKDDPIRVGSKAYATRNFFSNKKKSHAQIDMAAKDPLAKQRYEILRKEAGLPEWNVSDDEKLKVFHELIDLLSERFNKFIKLFKKKDYSAAIFSIEGSMQLRSEQLAYNKGIENIVGIYDGSYSDDPRIVEEMPALLKQATLEFIDKYSESLEKLGYPSREERQLLKEETEAIMCFFRELSHKGGFKDVDITELLILTNNEGREQEVKQRMNEITMVSPEVIERYADQVIRKYSLKINRNWINSLTLAAIAVA